MTAKKTTAERLKDARKVIEERGREIKTLEARISALQSMNKLFTGVWVRAENIKVRADGMKVQNESLMEQDVARKAEIHTLKEELREAVVSSNRKSEKIDSLQVGLGIRDLEITGHKRRIRKLNIALDTAWNRNDVLLGQLAGSQLMPDGRRASDHARGMILSNDEDTASTTGQPTRNTP